MKSLPGMWMPILVLGAGMVEIRKNGVNRPRQDRR
jgi:hypothetical protein